jgi:PAS domain S-box-containing protein
MSGDEAREATRASVLPDFAVIAFALAFAVVLAGGVLGYMNAGRLAQHGERVAHTYRVIGSLEALLSTLKDAETGQRGYLLAEDESYLQPYEQAIGRVRAELDRIKALTADNPDQGARLAALEARVAVRLEELHRTVDLAKSGQRAAALAVVRGNTGKLLMDDVRSQIASLTRAEQELLQRRNDELRTSYATTLLSILLPVAIATLLLGTVFVLARRNIRQRAAAAALLAEQKERLRITLASIGDAVISTDASARVTYLNAVAVELTGWTTEAAAGVPLTTVFNIVDESSRRALDNPAERALREGVVVGLANHAVLIARDGTEHPVDDSAAPIRSAAGEIVGCVLVFRDVTSRRHQESQLRASALALAESEMRLRSIAAELSESDRRKDEFLAMLAHELRNPLAPIRNGLHIMRLSGDDAAAVREARGMMERQIGQMVRLVDDLLDVSRISQGKLELRKERIELAQVVHSALETSRPLIASRDQELIVSLPPKRVFVDADHTRLAQVFANLLNNAAKYTERGGRITFAAARHGGEVVVSVKDNGVGIPPAMLSRVFDLFTQVDRTLEKAQGGLGIGLSLVRRLVEMHGGSVEARSEGDGRGSEFIVRLPAVLSELSETAPEAEPGTSALPHAGCRILVADDNADSASTLSVLLSFMGHEVRTANDGAAAVEMATAFEPDAILLDIGMPKLSGYEACRLIREQAWSARALLIALTGWGQDEDRRRSQEAGFDHHLTKPVDPAMLEKLLASHRGSPPPS